MLLQGLPFDFDLHVSNSGTKDPLNVYSINTSIYDAVRRENPISEEHLIALQGSPFCVVGNLYVYSVVKTPVWRGHLYELKNETHIFVGGTICSILQQMDEFVKQSKLSGNKVRPKRKVTVEAVDKINFKMRGY